DYRLPDGVKRVCYDADSGRYYFRDSEGLMYKGPVGSRFGVLTLGIEILTLFCYSSSHLHAVSEIPTSIPKVHQEINPRLIWPDSADKSNQLCYN
ncbi:hypothetical protein P692DRAFT_20751118, partial [Suillus brevipes Sb2]